MLVHYCNCSLNIHYLFESKNSITFKEENCTVAKIQLKIKSLEGQHAPLDTISTGQTKLLGTLAPGPTQISNIATSRC